MADPEAIHARLVGSPEGLDALVGLVVDHALERPLREVVDPPRMGRALADGLRATVEDPRGRAWLRERIVRGLAQPPPRGTLGGRLPPGLVAAVRELARRPWSPDPALVRGVADHPAFRKALRGVLQDTLLEFARRLSTLLPDASRIPGARSLLGMAKGVASAVSGAMGGEAERTVEARVEAFVDDVIGRAAGVFVAQITSPRLSPELSGWRLQLLDAVLEQPLAAWHRMARELGPDRLVADVDTLLRSLAEWEGLPGAVETLLARAVEVGGDESLRSLLEGSGLEEGWRPHLEAFARERTQAFARTADFRRWLDGLVQGV